MAVQKYRLLAQSTLLSTEMNGLVSGGCAVSAAFDNTAGAAGDGATLGDLELVWAYATGPTVGAVSVWLLGSQDGTSFEDGDATPITPGRAPDLVFAPRYSTAATQRQIQRIALPAGKFKVLLKNDGTSQAFAASSHTLKIRPVALEIV